MDRKGKLISAVSGAFMNVAVAVAPVPHNRSLTLYAPDHSDAERRQRSLPWSFRAWRMECFLGEVGTAHAMGVSLRTYQKFEQGIYRGLEEHHVRRFCKHVGIEPYQLAGAYDMPEALLHILIGEIASPTLDHISRRKSFEALYRYAQAAEGSLEWVRHEIQTAGPSHKLIVDFLNDLAHEPIVTDEEPVWPVDVMNKLESDVLARIKTLKSYISEVMEEKDPLSRSYNQARWLIFDGRQEHWKTLMALKNGFKNWKVVEDMVHRDPSVLGNVRWSAHDKKKRMLSDKMLTREDAIDVFLSSAEKLNDGWMLKKASEGEIFALSDQLSVLSVWRKSPQGREIVQQWHNRQVIAQVLEMCWEAQRDATSKRDVTRWRVGPV